MGNNFRNLLMQGNKSYEGRLLVHTENGNENQERKFEDCVQWKDITSFARDCSRICLPIIVQQIYEESVNRPKCQNGTDHICMMNIFNNMVKTI